MSHVIPHSIDSARYAKCVDVRTREQAAATFGQDVAPPAQRQ